MNEIRSIRKEARFVIKEYLKIRSTNNITSDKEIFREIINIRFKKGLFSNKRKKDDLILQSQISIGLSGFIIDICIIEWSLIAKAHKYDLEPLLRPIWEELDKIDLDDVTKYGNETGLGAPFFLNDTDGYLSEWHYYVYDISKNFHIWKKKKKKKKK